MTLPERTAPDYWNKYADANAKYYGHGSSSAPTALGTTANQNAMGHWFTTSATSGDTRGQYLRLYFAGAGGSGEAQRVFATVNGVTAATGGTVNGQHVSLSLSGAAAAISGASNAIRATYGIGTGVTAPGGTNAVIQLDSDIASGVTPATKTFFMRLMNSGSVAIGKFMETPNASDGTIFAAHGTDAMTHSLKCETAGGTAFYVMCTTESGNRS